MWAKVVDKVLLAMLFNPELITTLRSEFLHLPDFRTDIVQMASKELPLAASAFGDIASWFVQSVARLRRAKQQFETNLKMVGDSMPGSIMAAAEASELNHLQYMASIALDVDLYAKAIEKLEEEKETAEKQWKMLKENHIKDVKRFQDAMQQSECVCWQPLARVGLNTRKAWVLPAVEEAMPHRARLKTIIGCKDSGMFASKLLATLPLRNIDNIICNKSNLHCLV